MLASLMSADDVELVRRLFELFEARDYAHVAELVDPDLVLVRVGDEAADLAGEWRGVNEAWSAIVDYLRAWDDLRTETERLVDLGDRVLVLAKQIGRGRGSGATVERDVAFVFTVRGAKVVRWEGYWDRAEALRVAGLDE